MKVVDVKICIPSVLVVALLVLATFYFQGEKLIGIDFKNDLTSVEMKDQANFDFKYSDSIPIEKWVESSELEKLRYNEREKHNIRFTFENEQTGQKLNLLISQNEEQVNAEEPKDSEAPIESETVLLSNNSSAIYIEDEIAQKLWWVENNVSYGLIYFTYNGQQELEKSALVDIANNMK